MRDGIVLAAASVGDRYIDADPEPPDYSKPPRLRMVASSTPGQAHGRLLVERVRDEVEPDLVHDGCLSDAGARLAERMGLSGEAGVAPSKITNEKAVELANELFMFAGPMVMVVHHAHVVSRSYPMATTVSPGSDNARRSVHGHRLT